MAKGSINPQGKGNICGLGPCPVGCDKSPDMVCERGDGKGTKILLTIAGIILIGGFLILVIVLLLFTHHVYREERTLTIPAREIGNINRSTALRRAQRNNDSPDQESVAGNLNIERRKKNRLIFTKQALLQSFLYIIRFFAAWISPIILIIQLNFTDIVEEQEWRFC